MTGADRRAAWRLLFGLIRDHRHLVIPGIAAGVAWQLGVLALPVILGWTVRHGVIDGDASAVWTGAAGIVVVGVVEAVMGALRHRSALSMYALSGATVRRRLLERALADDPRAREWSAGELIGRATADTGTIADFMDAICHTVAHLVAVPVAIAGLFLIDPALGAGAVTVTPVIGLVMWRYSLRWEQRVADQQAAAEAMAASAEEVVEGFKVVAGLGAQQAMVERYGRRSEELRRRATHTARLWMAFEPLLDVLALLNVLVVLGVGGTRVVDGELRVDQLVVALGFALFLSDPVRTLGERVVTVQTALGSARRVVEVLGEVDTSVASRSDAPPVAASLVARDVVVRGRGDGVATPVSLDVAPSTLTLLDGAVGSGKSTLLAVMAGLLVPDGGEVRLDGRSLGELAPSHVRARVLLCGPAPFLFSGTLRENVTFGRPDADAGDADLRAAVEAVEMAEFVERLPDGLDTVIGERGVSLSGGQRQRVGLARAVLWRPGVLLLDGATSALDPEREVRVLRGIRQALPSCGLLVVATNPLLDAQVDHRIELAARSGGAS